MSDTIQFVARHRYLLVFLWLLGEQTALPIPSVPLLLISGALARTGELRLSLLILCALSACLIADNIWFQLGRRYSSKAVHLICKVSLEPDSCVRRTENSFAGYGLRVLLFSKFIPGLNVIAPPLAGGSGVHLRRFLLFESVGALIWVTTYIAIGYLFMDQMALALGYATRMGSQLVVVTIGLVLAWIAWKFFQRRRFVKSINVDRISAVELQSMLSAGMDVTIVDVRSTLMQDGDSIPGTIRIPAEDLPARHVEIPRDRQIVLFCT
jgi:membrane protein DedA with SNARE-associated domain